MHPRIKPLTLVQWATHPTNVLCKAAYKFDGIPGPPNSSWTQLHSDDQAPIVIEGTAVSSRETEVSGKLRTV